MLVNAIKGVVKTWKKKIDKIHFGMPSIPIEERLDWHFSQYDTGRKDNMLASTMPPLPRLELI